MAASAGVKLRGNFASVITGLRNAKNVLQDRTVQNHMLKIGTETAKTIMGGIGTEPHDALTQRRVDTKMLMGYPFPSTPLLATGDMASNSFVTTSRFTNDFLQTDIFINPGTHESGLSYEYIVLFHEFGSITKNNTTPARPIFHPVDAAYQAMSHPTLVDWLEDLEKYVNRYFRATVK